MLFGPDRDQLRSMYCQAWRLHQEGQALEPLQVQIVSVVEQHPEYQPLLENQDQALGREYLPEMGDTNPFLHMGLHLAIQEQIATDRPGGIRNLYKRLASKYPDSHTLDHQLMECLAEMIWRAQKNGETPDEQRYLNCIKAIAEEG
jgi:hypothetical protein